jgi:hypothetical protein
LTIGSVWLLSFLAVEPRAWTSMSGNTRIYLLGRCSPRRQWLQEWSYFGLFAPSGLGCFAPQSQRAEIRLNHSFNRQNHRKAPAGNASETGANPACHQLCSLQWLDVEI